MMKQSAEKTTSKNAVKTVIPSIWRTAGGKYSLIMLAIWLVVSAISLVWTPYSLLDTDGFNTWASPSGAHMLGTDGVGADVLSWLMAGSRTNLAIALLTVVVAAAIGLLLVAAMFVGTLLPNVELGQVSLNLGGAVIPLGVCIYLLFTCGDGKEVGRTLVGTVLTSAAVYALSVFLPDEPEQMWIDPNLLYGISGGLIAYVLGRSRRGAFICGVVGVMLADVVNALVLWSQGIQQRLTLGGAGLVDSVVISGILAVLLAEAVGEILERIQRGKKPDPHPTTGKERAQ